MKASNLIELARHMDAVLFLAAKQATTMGDWLAINAVAGKLIGELVVVDGNGDVRTELRDRAREHRIVLRQMLQRSCREAEALGFGRTNQTNAESAESAEKGGQP